VGFGEETFHQTERPTIFDTFWHQICAERGRTIGHCKDYPDANDELQAGYECWILPDLSEGVVINDGEVVANRLLAACAGIYRLEHAEIEGSKCCLESALEGSGLQKFMRFFQLKAEDLSLAFLTGRAVTYTGTHAASICTRPFAERLMLHLRKSLVFSMESDWRSGFECLLRHQGILQDNRLVLKILNMRPTFAIRLNDENFLSTLPATERHLFDACLLPGSSVGPLRDDETLFPTKKGRKTRRGNKHRGSKGRGKGGSQSPENEQIEEDRQSLGEQSQWSLRTRDEENESKLHPDV